MPNACVPSRCIHFIALTEFLRACVCPRCHLATRRNYRRASPHHCGACCATRGTFTSTVRRANASLGPHRRWWRRSPKARTWRQPRSLGRFSSRRAAWDRGALCDSAGHAGRAAASPVGGARWSTKAADHALVRSAQTLLLPRRTARRSWRQDGGAVTRSRKRCGSFARGERTECATVEPAVHPGRARPPPPTEGRRPLWVRDSRDRLRRRACAE